LRTRLGAGLWAGRIASLRPLAQRDFALVWVASLVSNIGSWMQTVAVGVLITDLTGRAGWTGLVAAAAFLPIGVLSPVGGAIADRVDRRRLLLGTAVAEAAFAAALAVVVGTGRASAGLVTVLVLAAGCMVALGLPAFQAILPDLVPRQDLLAASSLGLAGYNLGRVVGPALAGLVLAAGSFTWAFALNAISFGAVVLALIVVRIPDPAPSDERGGLLARITAGARGAAAEPGCRLSILTIAVVALLLSPFIALVPAIAIKLFDSGETGTSILITAQGVGAVAGALLLAPAARRVGRRRLLVGNLVVLPLLMVAYAASPDLAVATVAILAVGMAYVGVLSGLGTVVQLRAPARLRARILSLYMVALGVVYPIGAVIHGAIGDRVGMRTVTAGTALLYLVIVAVVATARPGLASRFDDPLPEEAAVPAPATLPPPPA
jgi:MFS family permease